jgi:hypothetical protein
MFLLWNALEGIQGTLYAQGVTSYTKGNPLDAVAANGESVLVYPGADGPVASARLEQIRDGIEDWDVLDLVRRKRGLAGVRTILGDAGLFSVTPERLQHRLRAARLDPLLLAAVVTRRGHGAEDRGCAPPGAARGVRRLRRPR